MTYDEICQATRKELFARRAELQPIVANAPVDSPEWLAAATESDLITDRIAYAPITRSR